MKSGLIVITLILALAAFLIFFSGDLPSESSARQALVTQGYSQIHLVEKHGWLYTQYNGCGREDVARFDFSAINAAHKRVRVYVCAGWPFKGDTIRYP